MGTVVRVLAAGVVYAAVALGCGAPSVALLTFDDTPPSDALHYFSPHTPVVVELATRADGVALPGLDRLRALGRRHGVHGQQVKRLLGGDLVVGIPLPGAAPLAAIVTKDGELLRTLADARVTGGRARAAGRYRGAQLYAGGGHAFGVRGRTLLVSRTTADLRDALDRRESLRTFGDGDFTVDADGRLARAVVDLGSLLPRGPWSAIPYVGAARRAGAVVSAGTDGRLELTMRLDTHAPELEEGDVPVARRAAHILRTRAPALAVGDLARLLHAGDRALTAAAPLTAQRLRRSRRALRAANMLVARLHGPATIVRSGEDVFLHAEPSRPVAPALRRLIRALPEALRRSGIERTTVRMRGSIHSIRRDGRALLRVGVVRGRLVAGTGSFAALRRLARTRRRRTTAPVAFGGPGGALHDWLAGWRFDGRLRATRDSATATVRLWR